MFQNLPVVTKNLIIINVILFIASQLIPNVDLWFSGFYFQSGFFRPWQIITHMFMHGSISHIFFNMFALYMFGSALEYQWGPKRFLNYYLLCGLGAFGLHEFINYIEISRMMAAMPAESVQQVLLEGFKALEQGMNFSNLDEANLNYAIHWNPVVGASGCVFGLLTGYGVLYPNRQLMLLFPPIPIKAKWLVIGYGAIELMLAFQNNPNDHVAHFAHLGGMIVGYIILKIWQSQGKLYS
ncbi:MAG: rhomboid family intramembrane serine protease [Flavobacteriales bacterium]|nr:rhomboid family intramembrane serine protease [Flavobacteriales bacterium]